MDFQEMGEEALPSVNIEEIITQLSETDDFTTDENQPKLPPTADMSTEAITNDLDCVAVPKLELPSATSSKSKHISVSSETKNKGIQEFVRILRPHLPRKAKSKAYKLMQNIAKGIVVESSSFQLSVRKRKTKKRPIRKPLRARNTKTKSLSIVRKNGRSLYASSDSEQSDASSCQRCGSCCRIARC